MARMREKMKITIEKKQKNGEAPLIGDITGNVYFPYTVENTILIGSTISIVVDRENKLGIISQSPKSACGGGTTPPSEFHGIIKIEVE